MRVPWVVVLLLGCRLSHQSSSRSYCLSNDQLTIHRVQQNNTILVRCPNMTGEDLSFKLLQDQTIIYSFTCRHEKTECQSSSNRSDVKPHILSQNHVLGFEVTAPTDKSHIIYQCQGEVIYPPPYRNQSAPGILVLVEGHQCGCNRVLPGDEKHQQESQSLLWMWTTMVVLLSSYSVSVTVLALVIWLKMRRVDSQNDYVNTKPQAKRGQRRNPGIQNPVQRHF